MQTPSVMTSTNFSGRQQDLGRNERMQQPVTPQQSISFGRQESHTISHLPRYQQQVRSYAGTRPSSSDEPQRGFGQRQEYRAPFPPYAHRRNSAGSIQSFASSGPREPTLTPDTPRPTSSNGSALSCGRREVPRAPTIPGYTLPIPCVPVARFNPTISSDSPVDGTARSTDRGTDFLNLGTASPQENVGDRKQMQEPVTPKTAPNELARHLKQVNTTISIAGPSASAPSAIIGQGQAALPVPSISLRSPFVPTFRAGEHNCSSRRPGNHSTERFGTLVDEEPVEKTQTKRRGELPVEPAEGLDRTPAVVGCRDPAKLIVQYETRKVVNNEGTPQLVKGAGAYYRYPHCMDWNNKEHIKKLNSWREQIHRRQFDRKRKTRYYWLESEKVAILEMFASHLEERALQDKHDPLWNRLANAYNTRFYERLQRTGSRFVADGRAKGDGFMDRDRLTPWRTANSLLGVSKKWPELKTMLMVAKTDLRDKSKQNGPTIKPRYTTNEQDSDDEEMMDPDQFLPRTTSTCKLPSSRKRDLVRDSSLKLETDEEDVREDYGEGSGGMRLRGHTGKLHAYDAYEDSDSHGPRGFGGDMDDSYMSGINLVDESDGEAEVPASFVVGELLKKKLT